MISLNAVVVYGTGAGVVEGLSCRTAACVFVTLTGGDVVGMLGALIIGVAADVTEATADVVGAAIDVAGAAMAGAAMVTDFQRLQVPTLTACEARHFVRGS